MYVAWRDLRFAKGRFALMGTVVVLITVLVGLLSGLAAGLGRENTSAITGLPADRLAFSAPLDGKGVSFSDSAVDERTWQRWAEVPGVDSAAPLGIATVRARAAGGRTAALSAFGVLPGSRLAPEGDRLAAGAAVLSRGAAEELGAAAGSAVQLGGLRFRVAAVAGDASYSHTPVAWTGLADWQRLSGSPGATVVALTTRPGTALATADRELGTRTVSRADALSAIGSYTSENGSLQLMRGFLFAISALVIGAFFTVWTIQRSGDVAVLKALGASTGYLLRDALGQAVVLLLLGTGAGSALAAGVGALVGGLVPFVLDPATVLVPGAVMVALGAVGAALAVRRITSVDPLTALGSAR
ncbi:ABC transporter permease [Peterkaempfera bronchialis]|uniref:ABC transporter permease n=1 Tax=Peterkaempfera bronchialis TaxID=2126346 RepID=UPI003C2EED65